MSLNTNHFKSAYTAKVVLPKDYKAKELQKSEGKLDVLPEYRRPLIAVSPATFFAVLSVLGTLVYFFSA